MNNPKEIANKIKHDAQTIQDMIKTRTGTDVSTKQLAKIADTLLEECKTGSQENHQTHIKRAISQANQELDTIATEFEKKCNQKQVNNLAKQEVKQSLSAIKTKLQAINKNNAEAHHTNDGAQRAQQTFGKESKQHDKHQSNTLNKNQMKGVFGSSTKTPPHISRKEPSAQPRRK